MSPSIPPRSIYMLSEPHAFGTDLGGRLESAGFQVEAVDDVEEMAELMLGLTPHVVLVDASHVDDLAAVGETRREAQRRSRDKNHPLLLVAMLPEDSVRLRLQARRAGAGALLFPPFAAADVVRQINELLAPTAQEGDRILIVEDDRAQALFAQSVLNNAGFRAEIEQNPLHVVEALEALRPDLILMDLHMPDANGVELTELIRENPAFNTVPIVFLSGDADPEAQLNAITAGGDDFLAKPIRPKYLIATVRNRIHRVRSMGKAESVPTPSLCDEASGLYRRDYLIGQVQAALAKAGAAGHDVGGLAFVRIIGSSALRSRVGLAAMERLSLAAGRVLVDTLDAASQMAAAVNDNAFVVLATGLESDALDALVHRLREKLMAHDFECGGMPLRLRIAVGVCPLRAEFADAEIVFDAAERASRDARGLDSGIKHHVSIATAERQRQAAEVAGLREAIEHDLLHLHYQPIVAVKGDVDAQYQTLVRMRDEDGKLHTAAVILQTAERGNLLLALDRWVIAHALAVIQRQQERWQPVRLFVPQSMATLIAQDQLDWLKAEMGRYAVLGSALVLECRAEDALLNPPALEALAEALRKLKVHLCLIQYEHGDDALRLLEGLRPAYIKLARKYVAVDAPPSVREEMGVIVGHAHRLGIRVIGSRVEDAQVAAALWMSGIDFIQGNLVHPVGEILDFDFKVAVL